MNIFFLQIRDMVGGLDKDDLKYVVKIYAATLNVFAHVVGQLCEDGQFLSV